jgi:hypothetical protein
MDVGTTAEVGLELPPTIDYTDLCTNAKIACEAAFFAENSIPYTPPQRINARTISLAEAVGILREYGGSLNATPAEIRNTVITKLILETENTDPRIRVKVYELLGKIEEVGLFSDKKQVTVTHQNAEEVKNKLKERLLELKKIAPDTYEAQDAEVVQE